MLGLGLRHLADVERRRKRVPKVVQSDLSLRLSQIGTVRARY